MDKWSDKYAKSTYEFGIYSSDSGCYVEEDIDVRGRDDDVVREIAEQIRRRV